MNRSITWQERKQLAKDLSLDRDPLPAPFIDEGEPGNQVPYAALEKGIHMRLPYVQGMAKGDKIVAGLSSNFGEVMFAETIKGGDQDELVHFSSEQIQHLQGKPFEAWYINQSWPPFEQVSPGRNYTVESWMSDPQIDEAVGDCVPQSAVLTGANLRLPGGLALTEGALVSIHLASSNSGAAIAAHLKVEAGEAGQDVVVPVLPSTLERCMDGNVYMICTVQSEQSVSISRLVSLKVEGEIEKLRPVYQGSDASISLAEMLSIDESGQIPMKVDLRGVPVGAQITSYLYLERYGPAKCLTVEVTQADKDQGAKTLVFPGPMYESGNRITCMIVVEGDAGRVSGSVEVFQIV